MWNFKSSSQTRLDRCFLGGVERGKPELDVHAACRERIATLEAILEAQQKLIEQMGRKIEDQQRKIEELEARLNRNSRNSSKPPSSDPPSAPPRPPTPPSGRKPGGQPGHEGHERPLLPPDQVSQVVTLKPERCRTCGKRLRGRDPDPLRHQVTELPELSAPTTEYQRHRLECDGCGDTTLADLPAGVPEGVFGPRLQAMLAYLSGQGHLSKRQIEELMQDAFGVTISLGSVVAAQQAVSEAVASAVEEARAYVEQQPVVHADETGWKEGPKGEGERGRKRAWLWVAVTSWVTVFLIHARRGAEGARALLGRFAGYLVTDRWNGYNAWPIRKRQVCWAHLIRDFVGFSELGEKAGKIGTRLLKEACRMFELWHRVRDRTLARSTFQVYLGPVRRRVHRLLRQGTRCGAGSVEGSCAKMLQVFPAFWTFSRVPGVEPTNNTAERTLRPAVLYRKGCFGTHSAEGSRFVERIFTVVATLRQQERNVMKYLTEACRCAQLGRMPPSILPPTELTTTAAA